MSRTLVSIFFLLIGVFAFVVFISPQFSKSRGSRIKLADLANIASELEDIAVDRDKLIDIYNSITQADIDRLGKMLPSGPNASSFLTNLEFLALKNNLQLKRLEFVGDTSATASRAQSIPVPSSVVSAVRPGENFAELPLSISIEGSYESFRNYLKDLEKSVRLLDINEINFGLIRPNTYEFTVKAKAYYQ